MIVKTSIEYEFNTDDMDMDPMTQEEFMKYAKSCMVDDIYHTVRYGDIEDFIRIEVRDND